MYLDLCFVFYASLATRRVVISMAMLKALRDSLRAVAHDERVVGRFHFDFDQNKAWKEKILGTVDGHGIVLINPGEFGMSGKVMKTLPLDTTADEITTAMLEANKKLRLH